MVHPPAFPPEQHVDAPVTVADPRDCDVKDTGNERIIVARARRVIESGSGQDNDAACVPTGDAVRVDEIRRKDAPLSRPHSFVDHLTQRNFCETAYAC